MACKIELEGKRFVKRNRFQNVILRTDDNTLYREGTYDRRVE